MSNLCSNFPLAPVQNASLQLNEITTQRNARGPGSADSDRVHEFQVSLLQGSVSLSSLQLSLGTAAEGWSEGGKLSFNWFLR